MTRSFSKIIYNEYSNMVAITPLFEVLALSITQFFILAKHFRAMARNTTTTMTEVSTSGKRKAKLHRMTSLP